MSITVPQKAIVVKRTNLALTTAINKAKAAGVVVVRTWTTGAKPTYRVLDEKVNPLTTITAKDLDFLRENKIFLDMADATKYKYNDSVKVEFV